MGPAENVNLDKEFPRCKQCGSLARPNVALFDDDLGRNARTFNPEYIKPQKKKFTAWFQHLVARKIVVLELGCGVNEHSLRMTLNTNGAWSCLSGEWKVPPLTCPL